MWPRPIMCATLRLSLRTLIDLTHQSREKRQARIFLRSSDVGGNRHAWERRLNWRQRQTRCQSVKEAEWSARQRVFIRLPAADVTQINDGKDAGCWSQVTPQRRWVVADK